MVVQCELWQFSLACELSNWMTMVLELTIAGIFAIILSVIFYKRQKSFAKNLFKLENRPVLQNVNPKFIFSGDFKDGTTINNYFIFCKKVKLVNNFQISCKIYNAGGTIAYITYVELYYHVFDLQGRSRHDHIKHAGMDGPKILDVGESGLFKYDFHHLEFSRLVGSMIRLSTNISFSDGRHHLEKWYFGDTSNGLEKVR